jgi:hypothetical protein
MLSRLGGVGFSVRNLGSVIGVDPMTVLHHFRSKEVGRIAFPATPAFIPAFKALGRDDAFDASLNVFLDGIRPRVLA